MLTLIDSILPVAVICELILLGFLSCIATFYEMKFKEPTYGISYLLPVVIFVILMFYSPAAGVEIEWGLLVTNVAVLLVILTGGLFLYRKMMGVSR